MAVLTWGWLAIHKGDEVRLASHTYVRHRCVNGALQKLMNDVATIGIQGVVCIRCVSVAPFQRKVPGVIICIFFAGVPSLVVVTACGAPRILESCAACGYGPPMALCARSLVGFVTTMYVELAVTLKIPRRSYERECI